MSVDLLVEVRIPLNEDDTDLQKYFKSTNHYRFWKPTKEYLTLFCSDHELLKLWRKSEDEVYDLYNRFIFDYQTGGNSYVVFSDSFRLNGGESVLSPQLISKLFPELEIEAAQCTDCDFEWFYRVYKNGEVIRDNVPEDECELGKSHLKRPEEIRLL